MAEEQVGLGKDQGREPAPYTRIFSAFRVAADPKKLLLAAAGIFVMALGWWLLASFFYEFNRATPKWSEYEAKAGDDQTKKEKEFKRFKQDLNNWNLLHKLAGPVAVGKDKGVEYTVADFSFDLKQYDEAQKELQAIDDDINRKDRLLKVEVDDVDARRIYFFLDKYTVYFKSKEVAAPVLKKELHQKVTALELVNAFSNDQVNVKGYTLTLDKKDTPAKEDWEKFEKYVNTKRQLADIEYELAEGGRKDRAEATRIALKVLSLKLNRQYKPAGMLATWPWYEHRGPNPFLMVTGMTAAATEGKAPAEGTAGAILSWLFTEQIPVLLEPLVKFLSPVVYFLHPAGYVWTKLYLLLIILWTILTWSFFGGAITRMASVQVARPTERVGMGEAIRFTISRYRAFVASQLLPFAFLAGITVILLIYGFFEILIPGLGDVLIAGVGFPLVLLFGLIMAVVVAGLVGWPLMYATISTEGSDSFDAISRSYSYVYQAPWQYLWYGFLALVYGAVLVFFVGLMGSLLVYLGKFGMSLPAGMFWEEREPSYLFRFAPTSYGWRDLMLVGSQYVETQPVVLNTGRVTQMYQFQPSYLSKLAFYNDVGSAMVAFWLFLLFLMVLGFGYSFFWSASSIVYLLMRRKVDDTEIDEVHLEEEEVETPAFTPPGTPAATPAAPAGRSTLPLNVVEAPATPATPAAPAAPAAVPATDATPATPPVVPPPDTTSSGDGDASSGSGPKKTQLAPGGSLDDDANKTDDSGAGST